MMTERTGEQRMHKKSRGIGVVALMPLVVFVMNSPKGMVAVLPIARRSKLPVDADVALPFFMPVAAKGALEIVDDAQSGI